MGVAAEAEAVVEVVEAAEAVEVGVPATELPVVIFYVEVIPSRNIRPYIPLTGSTTWTISTISSRPPHTVPTPHYTVIIRLYTHTDRSVSEQNRTQKTIPSNELESFVKETRISAGSFSSSVQKRF